MLKKSILLPTIVLSLSFLAQSDVNAKNANTRSGMQGEVSDSEAYIQTKDSGDSWVKATIKIKRTGSYTVIAGYFKDKCWHKGSFSGKEYFDTKNISGDSGDSLTVELEFPSPPMNSNRTIGVFSSSDSICTKG